MKCLRWDIDDRTDENENLNQIDFEIENFFLHFHSLFHHFLIFLLFRCLSALFDTVPVQTRSTMLVRHSGFRFPLWLFFAARRSPVLMQIQHLRCCDYGTGNVRLDSSGSNNLAAQWFPFVSFESRHRTIYSWSIIDCRIFVFDVAVRRQNRQRSSKRGKTKRNRHERTNKKYIISWLECREMRNVDVEDEARKRGGDRR